MWGWYVLMVLFGINVIADIFLFLYKKYLMRMVVNDIIKEIKRKLENKETDIRDCHKVGKGGIEWQD